MKKLLRKIDGWFTDEICFGIIVICSIVTIILGIITAVIQNGLL